ncbi:CCA tRNA nucleotidyltransferase [Alkalibacter mobilis]|uniref:CCA tRNA nucleotidyltransferase n=1 Tax=Alkalibacter mobilis TaxID=2787712 RepID=UPI00189DE465|nr:hypothetical protein [Alkalibacter mobilis]MBF7097812.1 hypothetical protein [Alkalibacter mobilis]
MNLPDNVYDLMEYIELKGYKAYLVGGAVRDILSNKKPKDFDFTTDAKPQEIKEIFEKHIETGIDFGTITVEFNKEYYEITTFRLEHRYSDGRRPDMVFYSDSLLSDLSRRDFTMNAIALDKDLNVYDYFNGIEDLKNKLLRTIGRAKVRFKEDKLRKLRAVRIACENGYLIHEEIVRSVMNDPGLEGVSMERIKTELDRILLCENAKRGVELLFRLHLMDNIVPGLREYTYPDMENWEDYTTDIEIAPKELSLRVYLMLRPIGDGDKIFHALKSLKYQRKVIEHCMDMWEYEKITSTEEFLSKLSKYSDSKLYLFKDLDRVLGRFPSWDEHIDRALENKMPRKVTDLEISGDDLKSLGLKGRKIGEVLNDLLHRAMYDPEINKKRILMSMVEKEIIDKE